MSVTLQQIKDHIRIDHARDDSQLTLFMAAAVDYVEKQCGIEYAVESCPALDLAVKMLVCTYYDNRGEDSPVQLSPIPHGVQRILDLHRVVKP